MEEITHKKQRYCNIFGETRYFRKRKNVAHLLLLRLTTVESAA